MIMFKVTRKEYSKINDKLSKSLERIKELELIKEKLSEDLEKANMKLNELQYRETLLEKERSELVNALSNSFEIRNELNAEIIKLKNKIKNKNNKKEK